MAAKPNSEPIKYDGVLHYEVHNISTATETVRSPFVSISDVPWRIVATFTMKEGVRHIGAFLQAAPEVASEKTGKVWSVDARAELRLLSKNPKEAIVRKTHHTYTQSEDDWGYSAFASLKDIRDPNKQFYNIERDSVIYEIAVKVCETKNIMTSMQLVKRVKDLKRIAEHQRERGLLDKALEANANAIKLCKGYNGVPQVQELEDQKQKIVLNKIEESIDRIEHGGDAKDPKRTLGMGAVKKAIGSRHHHVPRVRTAQRMVTTTTKIQFQKTLQARQGSVSTTQSEAGSQGPGSTPNAPKSSTSSQDMEPSCSQGANTCSCCCQSRGSGYQDSRPLPPKRMDRPAPSPAVPSRRLKSFLREKYLSDNEQSHESFCQQIYDCLPQADEQAMHNELHPTAMDFLEKEHDDVFCEDEELEDEESEEGQCCENCECCVSSMAQYDDLEEREDPHSGDDHTETDSIGGCVYESDEFPLKGLNFFMGEFGKRILECEHRVKTVITRFADFQREEKIASHALELACVNIERAVRLAKVDIRKAEKNRSCEKLKMAYLDEIRSLERQKKAHMEKIEQSRAKFKAAEQSLADSKKSLKAELYNRQQMLQKMNETRKEKTVLVEKVENQVREKRSIYQNDIASLADIAVDAELKALTDIFEKNSTLFLNLMEEVEQKFTEIVQSMKTHKTAEQLEVDAKNCETLRKCVERCQKSIEKLSFDYDSRQEAIRDGRSLEQLGKLHMTACTVPKLLEYAEVEVPIQATINGLCPYGPIGSHLTWNTNQADSPPPSSVAPPSTVFSSVECGDADGEYPWVADPRYYDNLDLSVEHVFENAFYATDEPLIIWQDPRLVDELSYLWEDF
ncbi:hypothetical protein L596_014327 [Steinernema carpocapsae]|uniref:MATH domain-containing protein n=1 Tax=Steinernema carpocapsae TaxID=34508 RepID=A0A4U5NCF1_STECR|nr:hypothetical protein L596_014327 [Steinernema carpocapsae]